MIICIIRNVENRKEIISYLLKDLNLYYIQGMHHELLNILAMAINKSKTIIMETMQMRARMMIALIALDNMLH